MPRNVESIAIHTGIMANTPVTNEVHHEHLDIAGYSRLQAFLVSQIVDENVDQIEADIPDLAGWPPKPDISCRGPMMSQKIDNTILDQQIIRRALHNAEVFDTTFSEFRALGLDPVSGKEVEFIGTIDSQISLKSARIQAQDEAYDLQYVFSASELRGFNYLIKVEHSARLRNAA